MTDFQPGQKVRRRWLDRGPREGQVGEVLGDRPFCDAKQYFIRWADGAFSWVHEDVLELAK